MTNKSIDLIKAPKGSVPEYPKETKNDSPEKDELAPAAPTRDFANLYLGLGIVSVLILIGLSLALLFYGSPLKKEKTSQEKTPGDTKTSQDNQASQTTNKEETPTTQEAKSQEKTATAPETPGAAATTEATIDKGQVRIKIANGNGRTGEAAVMRNILKQEGYAQIQIGNARNRYKTTIIFYAPGKEKEATEIEKAVARKYQTSLLESSSTVGGSLDVVVALGNK